MQAAAEAHRVAAWTVYPSAGGWRFDDPAIAIPFLEKARALGVKIVCAHRGIAGDDGGYAQLSSPREMVKVASAFPDLAFLVYHSGYEGGVTEGPYDDANPRGIDRLVKALREFPATNIYAELGSTFRALMTDPTQLAHALGKLLLHVGVDRVLWGTDCIWYGSPQEQIAALRAFQIPEALLQQHGYPALTADVKRKILGLNGAAVYGVDPNALRCAIKDDDLARAKQAANDRDWPVRDYGPRTRRELLRMLRGA
jgi:predicted TIM-barrel fold metal-dependent hydrolase